MTDQEKLREAELALVTRRLVRATYILAFFAALSFIAALLQWNAMNGQLREMQTASNDTHILVGAAKTQAAAAKSSAETAAKALGGLERPYISISLPYDISIYDWTHAIGNFIKLKVTLTNYGRHPALVAKAYCHPVILGEIPTEDIFGDFRVTPIPEPTGSVDVTIIAPSQSKEYDC